MSIRSVHHCARSFDRSVKAALQFHGEARHMRLAMPGGASHALSVRHIETFAGLTLLKIHLAWEDFVEDVFLRYMCGALAPCGTVPVLTGAPAPNVSAAMSQLLRPNWTYLQWGAESTMHWANQYFQKGEPFSTAIGAVRQSLDEIADVRNRFAHRSEAAQMKFQAVVRRHLGYVPKGMTTGRFLLRADPSSAGQTFVETYGAVLLAAAAQIAP